MGILRGDLRVIFGQRNRALHDRLHLIVIHQRLGIGGLNGHILGVARRIFIAREQRFCAACIDIGLNLNPIGGAGPRLDHRAQHRQARWRGFINILAALAIKPQGGQHLLCARRIIGKKQPLLRGDIKMIAANRGAQHIKPCPVRIGNDRHI